jgi:hypothetical protein
MGKENCAVRVMKWVGVLAMIVLPLVVFAKKRKPDTMDGLGEDDSNIFASELQE